MSINWRTKEQIEKLKKLKEQKINNLIKNNKHLKIIHNANKK